MKHVSPSLYVTAFNCPHCGALAQQFWFEAHAEPMKKDEHPRLYDPDKIAALRQEAEKIYDETKRSEQFRLLDGADRVLRGLPFLEHQQRYIDYAVMNLWFSRCYNCEEISLWIYDKLAYPQRGEAPPVNPDIPEDIRRDYDEASTILDFSPRGAAALIRLAIQKLCKHLGQPGENINADIKALVAGGLDHRVQKALDVVRVIGNNAVHPGQIDMRDDRALAETLFRLLNLIAEKMISEPKHVDEVYASLPEGQRLAIEKRDGRT